MIRNKVTKEILTPKKAAGILILDELKGKIIDTSVFGDGVVTDREYGLINDQYQKYVERIERMINKV